MYFLWSVFISIYLLLSSINVNGCRIEVYPKCNYAGTKKTFTGPIRTSGIGIMPVMTKIFKWELSFSFKMYSNQGEKCAFYLFETDEHGNQAWYFSANDGASRFESCVNINNAFGISTIIVREEKLDCTVELFKDDLFSGGSYTAFGIGQYYLTQMKAHGVPNDAVSSMKVTAYPNIDCVVELYKGVSFSDSKAVIPITRDRSLKEYYFNLQELKNYGFTDNALSSLIVKPKETIQRVTWLIDEKQVLTTAPFAMGSVDYDNQGSSSSLTWSKTLEKSETSGWEISYTHTVGVTVEWSVEFGSPIFGASQELSVSIGYEFSLTSSNSGSTTNTYSESIEKEILPGQVGGCDWTMKKATIDVPFTAVINKIDGFGQYAEETVGGVWKGVALHDSLVKCVDTDSPCNQNVVPSLSYHPDNAGNYVFHIEHPSHIIMAIFILLFVLIASNMYCCYTASVNRKKHQFKKLTTFGQESEYEKEQLE